ncbi:MAG: hypothetical protein HQM08_19505 [Candidatus Riflebacteria bacterium]|nr:hypothetical protein [Candidatus Riflebacteria bacterium]
MNDYLKFFIALFFLLLSMATFGDVPNFNFSFVYKQVDGVEPMGAIPASNDPGISYEYCGDNTVRIRSVDVTSEQELLSAMRVGNPDSLSDGQRGLLAAFRYAQSEEMQNRMRRGTRTTGSVIMYDFNGFDNDPRYSFLREHGTPFWPSSYGGNVQISSGYLNTTNFESRARTLLAHETGHMIDTDSSFASDYNVDPLSGRSNGHSYNETMNPSAALGEGWADFQELLAENGTTDWSGEYLAQVTTSRGQLSVDQLNGPEFFQIEGYVGLLLYRLSRALPNGIDTVYTAFLSIPPRGRTMNMLFRNILNQQPFALQTLIREIDDVTRGKFSNEEMANLLGVDVSRITLASSSSGFQNVPIPGRKPLPEDVPSVIPGRRSSPPESQNIIPGISFSTSTNTDSAAASGSNPNSSDRTLPSTHETGTSASQTQDKILDETTPPEQSQNDFLND